MALAACAAGAVVSQRSARSTRHAVVASLTRHPRPAQGSPLGAAPSGALLAAGSPAPGRPRCAGGVRWLSDLVKRKATSCEAGAGQLRLSFGAACLPHPDKVEKGGEDAYFASPHWDAFGVADGVGGWAESGVDPGIFSRQLLQFCYEDLSASTSKDALDLQANFSTSEARLLQTGLEGGTTTLLGHLHGTTLSVLNLGDSGVLVLRPAARKTPGSNRSSFFPRKVFRSSDQTHYFNCPFQVSSTGPCEEEPDLVHVEVRHGDIVVAATDGVFDNLFDHQVQTIVARHFAHHWQATSRKKASPEKRLQKLAASISEEAQRVGLQEDQDVLTPFVWSAHTEGISFQGGKLDDVTVVVGLVSNSVEKKAELGEELQPQFHNFDCIKG